MRRLIFLTLLCLTTLTGWGTAHAQTSPCATLVDQDLTAMADAPSQITSAKARSASNGEAPACVVEGYSNRAIGWRIFLPDQWNGKLIQEGCGGRCGALRDTGCNMLVRRGYACVAADLGHAGSNFDAVWAIGNPVAQMDAGFRATHVANRVAREIVTRHYQKPATRVYYTAVSAGGRQGLIAAQRFPDDFDGIIVGGPAMTRSAAFDRFPTVMAWASSLIVPGGKPLLLSANIRALHAAVLAACDRDDGLADGILSLPLQCRFDPATLACTARPGAGCLNEAQLTAVRALYAGMPPRDGLDPGIAFLKGSELAWIGDYVTADDRPGPRVPHGPAPTTSLYDSVFLYSADPDLRPFAALGHKLIVFQGLADTITPPGRTTDYVRQVHRAVGGTVAANAFLRYYLVPGMKHEPGGMAAEAVDWVRLLDDWVEQGKAPETIIAAHLRDSSGLLGPTLPVESLRPANVDFTRPLYPYPMVATYRKGPPDQAASFAPRPAVTTEGW